MKNKNTAIQALKIAAQTFNWKVFPYINPGIMMFMALQLPSDPENPK